VSFFTRNTLVILASVHVVLLVVAPIVMKCQSCAINMYVAVSSEFLPDFIWQKYRFVLNKKSILKLD